MLADRDLKIAMRDGVRVTADTFRPEGSGPFPTLYAVSPYNKNTAHLPPSSAFRWREAGNIALWVEQGYAFIHADTRGTGQSREGQWNLWSTEEQTDLYDTIEWAACQPWSNGKVGMIGESYYAAPQWLAATLNPPHLACIAPYDGLADVYRDALFHGGICSIGFLAWWATNTKALTLLEDARPGVELPQHLGGDDLVGMILAHPFYDEFWKSRNAYEKFSNIKVPFYSIANWTMVGLHLRGNLLAFEEIEAPKKLLVTGGGNHHASIEAFHSGEIHDELTRWYDYWLKGINNGIMAEPPVKIFVTGEGYRDEWEWPPKRAEYRTLYLTPEKASCTESLNDGSLSWSPPELAGSTRYDYPDAAWGGWPGFGTAASNSRGMMDGAVKILSFSSPPLEQDLEVTGPIQFRAYLSSTAPDTDIIVKIYEVPSGPRVGPLMAVTRGWLKASHRALDPQKSRPQRPFHSHDRVDPIEPGVVYEMDVEVWPTSHLFKKGSRIRLDVANGDSPVFDMPFNHYYGTKIGTDFYHHGAQHLSCLKLPVILR